MTETKRIELKSFLSELALQDTSKRDYILQGKNLTINDDLTVTFNSLNQSNEIFDTLGITSTDSHFKPTETFLRKISEKTEVGVGFLKRFKDVHPDLVATNFNYLLTRDDTPRMIRCFESAQGNVVRSFLSDKFSRIDNIHIIEAVVNALQDRTDFLIHKTHIDSDGMKLTILFPEITFEDRDSMYNGGIYIANNEVGNGAVQIKTFIYRSVCSNGLIMGKQSGLSFSQKHLTSKQPLGLLPDSRSENYNLRDVEMMISSIIENFGNSFEQFMGTKELTLKNPTRFISNIGSHLKLQTEDIENIFNIYISKYSKHNNLFGVVNAFTHYAHAEDLSKPRQFELEELAGQVLETNKKQFSFFNTHIPA